MARNTGFPTANGDFQENALSHRKIRFLGYISAIEKNNKKNALWVSQHDL